MDIKKELKKKCFVIAEISANHGQDFRRALDLIKKAKDCGADAVKFQLYTPDTLTIDCDNKYFRIKGTNWAGQSLYGLYQKAYTPWDWFKRLKAQADKYGLVFFATAFDRSSVDFLEKLGVPVHKISSFELVDIPLIKYAAATGKPLILSTGMATLSEIKEAVSTAKKAGAKDILLLKCVSSYPAKPEEMNLKTIKHMENAFGYPVGISDHSLGLGVSVAAVALGAKIVERHFCLSRKIKTPDSFFSLEPQELKELVNNVRIVEKAAGKVHYGLSKDEKKMQVFRRSLFAVKEIQKDEILTEHNVRSIRPEAGLKPKYLESVIGRAAAKCIKRGTPLKFNLIK